MSSHKRTAETIIKIPQRTHVPGRTVEDAQTPSAGVAATICRTAISRNTTECTRATIARLRLVRMENPPMPVLYRARQTEAVMYVTAKVGTLQAKQTARKCLNLRAVRWSVWD